MAATQATFHELRHAGLDEIDPEIARLVGDELERQRGQIELIASENFTWPSVLEAVGSVPTNKYAEGYPGRRYYGGCEVIDQIEQLAIDRAKELFGAEHANVQPHAGAQTNMAVYAAVMEPGRPGSWYGSGCSRIVLIVLNTALFAPIPSASVKRQVIVKAGAFRI